MGNYFRSKIFCLGVLSLLFFAAKVTGAAGEHFIKEVRIEGETRISEATIRHTLHTKPGSVIDRDEINADIRRLFQLGYFKDVQVHQEKSADGWVVTFAVTEKPLITKVVFEGNKKIKEKDLKEALAIPLYQPLNEQKVSESIAAIRELYAKKRYYLVEIDYKIRTSPQGDYEFVFTIKENQPAFIRQMQFIGNTVFTDDELRKVIKTKKKGFLSWLFNTGKYDEETLKQDVLRLTFHYLKNGYLKVQVEQPQITLTKDKRYFFITFHVQEGDRYRVGKVDVAGDILTTREELAKNLLTQPGQIYNREFIEKDMMALTETYANVGYAFVHINPLTDTHEVEKTADITFQVTKGNRITIENINIIGNTSTRDKVVRRELMVKEGDIYNEAKMKESREKVSALGYFKDVNFATPRGSKDDALNLDITVEERPTGSFSLGAGFSTVENFILTGSLSKQNFFGYGWSGELSTEISSRRQQYLFSMTDPYFMDTEWILSLSSFRTIFRYENFDRESYGGSFSIGHRFFDHSSMSLGYQAEQVSAVDFASFVPDRFRVNSAGLTSMVSATLNRDTRDDRVYASRGTFNSAKFEISGTKLGGDNDFYRVTGRSQFYQPLGKGFSFKTFSRIGYMHSLGANIIPLYDRFFMGGVNSLRGYYPQSIGPSESVVDANGNPTRFVFGGNKMIIFNVEMEYPIYEPAAVKFVTFFDAGNAFAEEETLDIMRLRLDYGFGLRWISPMGPLRFEWGFPIDREPNERENVFNFTIGSFF